MEKGFGIYQYINTYKTPRNGKTFFYRYDKTDEIHILAYVKTDLFQEADIVFVKESHIVDLIF